MAEKLTKKELKELRRMEKTQAAADPNASSNSFKWIALSLGALLIVGLFGFLIYNLKQQNAERENQPVVLSDLGWTRAASESASTATLVEFADFQCPHCKQYEPLVQQALTDIDGLQLLFKHFPLSFQYSMLTAKASEAAGKQGKFWEMHDLLFQNQEAIAQSPNGRELMISYAEALELDVEQFTQDLDGKELEKKIQDMENEGIQNGVTGTPSFFVNGRRIELAGSYEEFKASIEAAMNEQENPATTK